MQFSFPGGAAVVEVEIDFGSTPQWSKSFVISNAAVSPDSKVVAWQSSKTASGRVGNDAEWDQLSLAVLPGSGSFVLTALALPGPIVGARTILYQIAA